MSALEGEELHLMPEGDQGLGGLGALHGGHHRVTGPGAQEDRPTRAARP